jgi:hypothetical protein
MLTKRIAGGAALVLTMASAIRGGHAGGDSTLRAEATGTGAGPRIPAAGPDPRSFYLAGKRATDTELRRRHFAQGVQLARARLAARPDDPEGLLWLAANLGSEALERGKLVALRVLPEMERLLLRLEATAPLYDHAAAARTLGRLYHKAPGIISIGSMKRAREYFERALSRAGDYPANQILAADFFADDGDRERARDLATRYLAHPETDDTSPDAALWRDIAFRITGRKGAP